MKKNLSLLLLSSLLVGSSAFAKGGGGGGGGFSISASFGVVTTGQDDLNTLQQRANARETISTSQLGSAYEASGSFGYRFSGTMFELMLRPSYFWQTADGSGSGGTYPGSYTYSITGFTIFPVLKIYPLENEFMKFFFTVGVGYGRMDTKITEASFSVEAVGNSFGYLAGLGAEMCFTESHCMVIEGNLRGLPAERNIIQSISGSPASTNQGVDSGLTVGHELEMDGHDLKVTGSGIQASVAYVMRF